MKRVLLLILIILSVSLVACGSQKIYLCPDGSVGGGQVMSSNKITYYCPNGKAVRSYGECEFSAMFTVTQENAEEKAINFVDGYLGSNGWDSTLVNVNLEESNWFAQIVVSKYDEQSFETTIKIDGMTGFTSCDRNCEYLG